MVAGRSIASDPARCAVGDCMRHRRPFAASVMKVAANETMRMIELQAFRARSRVGEDDAGFFDDEMFRRDADRALFAFALWRLYEIADLTRSRVAGTDGERMRALTEAQAAFVTALPDFEILRHLTVHIADYAAGRGHDHEVDPGGLYSGTFVDGVRPVAGRGLDMDTAIQVSQRLYVAVVGALDLAIATAESGVVPTDRA